MMNLDPNKKYSLEETIDILTNVPIEQEEVIKRDVGEIEGDVRNQCGPVQQDMYIEGDEEIKENVRNPYEPVQEDRNIEEDEDVDLNIFSLHEINDICKQADDLGRVLENDYSNRITTAFDMVKNIPGVMSIPRKDLNGSYEQLYILKMLEYDNDVM